MSAHIELGERDTESVFVKHVLCLKLPSDYNSALHCIVSPIKNKLPDSSKSNFVRPDCLINTPGVEYSKFAFPKAEKMWLTWSRMSLDIRIRTVAT